MKPQDKVLVILGSAAIIATAGFGGYALFTGGDTTKTSAATSAKSVASSTPSATTTVTPTTSATSSYADGTYVASVNYYVPDDGRNTLRATVTISNGAISSVATDNTYRDRKSRQYVDGFESGITSAAVDRPVADFSVGRVGGASLTSSAFNDALDTIRNEAKA